jgi:glycosyltransferase involved in cell wall biosynthesis
VVYAYANALVDLGYPVTIVHGSEGQFQYSNRTVPPLPLMSRARHLRDRLLRPVKLGWFELDQRVQVINSPRMSVSSVPDSGVIVATSCWSAPFVASLPDTKGRKFYFIQHHETWSADEEFVNSTWKLPLQKIVIARWLERIGEELGVTTEYVPNSIDSSEFPEGPAIEARPLLVSALVSDLTWKRTDLLIDVLKIIRAEVPEARANTFGTCARPKDLPDWVEYTQSPTRKQLVSDIYQQSRVYICTSDGEGWHLPPAEAMACGSSVVSTDIDGVKEYAENIALFSPTGDATGLARQAIRLLQDPQSCGTAASRGTDMIRSYQPADAANRLLNVLFPNE